MRCALGALRLIRLGKVGPLGRGLTTPHANAFLLGIVEWYTANGGHSILFDPVFAFALATPVRKYEPTLIGKNLLEDIIVVHRPGILLSKTERSLKKGSLYLIEQAYHLLFQAIFR
jgi:hypothetical protein